MARKDRIDALGGTVLVAFSALLGLNQVLVKIVNGGLQPVFQAGLRSACAILPILIYALLTRKRLSVTDGSLAAGILCGFFFAGEFVLLFVSLEFTTVARASIMFYTMPLWLAVAVHFLIPGERLTMARITGLALAVVAIVVALSDSGGSAGPDAVFGDLLSLVASFGWAAVVLTARLTRLSRSTPEMQLLYQLIVSAPLLLFVALFFGDFIREPTPAIWGIFAFQVLGVVCVGFLSWFWVLSVYPASDMAAFSFLAPLFGVLFGWLMLGEELTVSVLAALALVSAGIVLVNRKAAPRTSSPAVARE